MKNSVPILVMECLFIGCFFSCKTKNGLPDSNLSTISKDTSIEINMIEPPPLSNKLTFSSFQDWLAYECQLDSIKSSGITSNFRLFKVHANYAIYLVASEKLENKDVSKKDIAVIGVPFQFNSIEYQHLNNLEVLRKVETKIREFMQNAQSKDCMFRKSKEVTLSWGNTLTRQLTF